MSIPRVLLVDDDSVVLVSVVRLLQANCRVDVVTETRADRALDMLNSSPFDLLVADMRLPGISGTELLTIAAERWPHMRRALLTGGYADEWPEVADSVFLKGSDPQDIVGRICELARFQRATP